MFLQLTQVSAVVYFAKKQTNKQKKNHSPTWSAWVAPRYRHFQKPQKEKWQKWSLPSRKKVATSQCEVNTKPLNEANLQGKSLFLLHNLSCFTTPCSTIQARLFPGFYFRSMKQQKEKLLQPQLCHLLAVWSKVTYFTSLSPDSFFRVQYRLHNLRAHCELTMWGHLSEII